MGNFLFENGTNLMFNYSTKSEIMLALEQNAPEDNFYFDKEDKFRYFKAISRPILYGLAVASMPALTLVDLGIDIKDLAKDAVASIKESLEPKSDLPIIPVRSDLTTEKFSTLTKEEVLERTNKIVSDIRNNSVDFNEEPTLKNKIR